MQPIIWSHSSYKMFSQCRRQYNLVKRLKVVKPSEFEGNSYGKQAHKAIEEYLLKGIPLPEEFRRYQSWIDTAASLPGHKLVEAKLGMTIEGKPTEFFAKDVWWRGLPDLAIINEEKQLAHVCDWKFSKNARYADRDQLELLALAIFARYPMIKKVKGLLAFLVSNEPVVATYHRRDFAVTLSKWIGRIDEIRKAEENDVWNPTSSGLCNPYCPATKAHCEFKE